MKMLNNSDSVSTSKPEVNIFICDEIIETKGGYILKNSKTLNHLVGK